MESQIVKSEWNTLSYEVKPYYVYPVQDCDTRSDDRTVEQPS